MTFTEEDLFILSKVAKEAAIAAGEYIQSQLNSHLDKKHKIGIDSLASQIVTQVDLKSQEIILDHLQESITKYDLGLLTEEAPDDESRTIKSYFWCVDPMDGTLPFIEGKSGYAVSIALIEKGGNPLIGVVYIPDIQECYSSVKGKGVRLNNELFQYTEVNANDIIHIYMDRSLCVESYFERVKSELNQWMIQKKLGQIEYHVGFGAVRNALGVMNSGMGCYFKFPKKQNGGGSIWDYAATRLFFEELGLFVSNVSGNPIDLNNPNTTFMNEMGVVYANDEGLSEFVVEMGVKVAEST
ncbi:3'(2'),5'-bisphosphate nucleotidase CysQ family protein [Ekhidna sp.]